MNQDIIEDSCWEKKVKQQNKELMRQYKRLAEYHDRVADMLLNIMILREIETPAHLMRVAAYSRILSMYYAILYPHAKMTSKRVHLIAEAAKLHDVGKLVLPDSLIQKKGKLSKQELDSMMEHTLRGSEIMELIDEFRNDDYAKLGYNICKYHHARCDGSGYPPGVCDEQIPVEAQIVSLADLYDVLVHEPINNHVYSKTEAFTMLMEGQCGELTPKMKDCLFAARRDLEAWEIEEPIYDKDE